MSLATIDRAPLSPVAPVPTETATTATADKTRLRAVPVGTEARGFALYVGLDEFAAVEAGTDLGAVVEQLKQLIGQLVPGTETYAAVALAPAGAGGRDVDVVRLALQDPAALARHRQVEDPSPKPRGGVIVDISRKRVVLDGQAAPLTYKEFELLQYLVLREGRTIDRSEIIAALWSADEDEVLTSAPSTFTLIACAPSWATSKTSCAPCAASITGSTVTPTCQSGRRRLRADFF